MINDSDDEQDDVVELSYDDVKKYSSNSQIIKFIRKKFKRLNLEGTMNLIKLILWKQFPIKIDDITKAKSFKQYNMSKIEGNILKEEFVKVLILELNNFLKKIGKQQIDYNEKENRDLYKLNKYSEYEKIRKYLCDERGDVDFVYDFNNNDITENTFDNKNTLQKNIIQIMSSNLKFDYPLEYKYSCIQCGNEETKKAYETICTNNRLICSGIYEYVANDGAVKRRQCRLQLSPDMEVSFTKTAYYYDINYDDPITGEKQTAGGFSFLKLLPGFYECVFFKISQPRKVDLIQIMDIKKIQPNDYKLPEKKEDENYVFTLQKSFDVFLKKQTGMKIWGLIPIKCALILQKLVTELNEELVYNIQIVGDASTGKSTVLKYYGFLLNNNYHLSTAGANISIAALRGTKTTVNLLGKENKVVTIGHLGNFKTIHIDEAGENKELVQNLKPFLTDSNYSYDKAGSTGIFHKRTAQINLSENISYDHIGQYRGSIRKGYKDRDEIIEGINKPEWDENWDLHLPLNEYEDNMYLYRTIEDKRTENRLKQIWWIDGYNYPLHERFLFYFYLVNEKQNIDLLDVVKENIAQEIIHENFNLMKCLKTNVVDDFFKGLKKYVAEKVEYNIFKKIDEMLKKYDLHDNARIKKFYYVLLKLSRIINQRNNYIQQDYDLVQYILQKTNVKLDVCDTNDYKIKKITKKINIPEESIKKMENKFKLPEGEFE